MSPDEDGRIDGTSYEEGVHPEGSVPLRRRRDRVREFVARLVFRGTVRLLRPQPGDVLVISRYEADRSEVAALSQRMNRYLHHGGERDPLAVVLPGDAMVHLEDRRLKTEDRGYRETMTYGKDRGVHVGLPSAT